jgi:hypothetical protein
MDIFSAWLRSLKFRDVSMGIPKTYNWSPTEKSATFVLWMLSSQSKLKEMFKVSLLLLWATRRDWYDALQLPETGYDAKYRDYILSSTS